MTTTQRSYEGMSKITQEALVDQLRSCHTEEEILTFEKWFNSEANEGELYIVICNFLRNRNISRVLAAKWLSTLISNRDRKLIK